METSEIPVRRTWRKFWGELLLARVHRDNPDRLPSRERKAEWMWSRLGLAPGARILDLGCGDGILDVALARRGAFVVAVDRIESVLSAARREAGALPVTFLAGDLRTVSFAAGSFDAILLLETVGLMSRAEDADLIGRCRRWLKDGGRFVVDAPREPDEPVSEHRWDIPEGRLTLRSSYDRGSRLLHMNPVFHGVDRTTILLHEPYDASRGDHDGVLRSIYAKDDLSSVLSRAGFRVEESEHYSSPRHDLLLGTA